MTKDRIKTFADEHEIKLKSFKLNGFVAAYRVEKQHLIKLLKFLKNTADLRFAVLTDLFAADFPERAKRFEVVYNLLSLELNQRILLKIELEDGEGAPSATSVHSAAGWYEREVFDMFGINFTGSPDMRRILTDYGFKGHPLRKDFPVTGHVQVKYDEKLEEVVYEPVVLEQEFRSFDFASPWRGPDEYVLPGDEKATK